MSNTVLDRKGRPVSIGDGVTIVEIPEHLLAGLPEADRRAIARQFGNTLIVSNIRDEEELELEFVDGQQQIHTIWLLPSYVEKT